MKNIANFTQENRHFVGLSPPGDRYNTTLLPLWGNSFSSNMNTAKHQTSHAYGIPEILKKKEVKKHSRRAL